MKKPLVLAALSGMILVGAAYPELNKPDDDDARVEQAGGGGERYRACRSRRDDNCIQLYERGVRASYARWLRDGDPGYERGVRYAARDGRRYGRGDYERDHRRYGWRDHGRYGMARDERRFAMEDHHRGRGMADHHRDGGRGMADHHRGMADEGRGPRRDHGADERHGERARLAYRHEGYDARGYNLLTDRCTPRGLPRVRPGRGPGPHATPQARPHGYEENGVRGM